MTELRLTQGELNQRAAEVRRHAQEVDDALNGAHSKVQALLADWSGQAQTAFDQLWSAWRQGALQCHTAMVEIAQRMEHAGTGFQAGEEDISRSLS